MAELDAIGKATGGRVGGAWATARQRIDPAIVSAFGCIALLLLVGSLYSSSFLSPEYLLQQLKVASFLGVIATGMLIVILLGQIDLSVPWVVAVGGMMATAATGWGPLGGILAIPVGIGCGVALGLVNGFGVAFLRIPSMVVTLAVNAVAQGLMVVHTGGFSPQDASSPAMRFIATGHSLLGIPNALLVWAAVGAVFGALMFRTIGDLLFVFNLDPLWQPLFQGVVLLAAICLGSVRLLRIRNRLDLYG